jgi:hypothetical protein
MGDNLRLRNNVNDPKVASLQVIPTSPAFTSRPSIDPCTLTAAKGSAGVLVASHRRCRHSFDHRSDRARLNQGTIRLLQAMWKHGRLTTLPVYRAEPSTDWASTMQLVRENTGCHLCRSSPRTGDGSGIAGQLESYSHA